MVVNVSPLFCFISYTFHSAFVAYLGYVTVLVAHRHPVMLVFCQLLLDRNKDYRPLQERKSSQCSHVFKFKSAFFLGKSTIRFLNPKMDFAFL